MGWTVVGRREGSGGKVFTKFSPQGNGGHGDQGLENSNTLILFRAPLRLNVNANHSAQKISAKESVSKFWVRYQSILTLILTIL